MHHQRRAGRLGIVVGLSSALTGALVATTALPAAASRGPRVTNRAYRFTFVLPPGWNQIALDPAHLGDLVGPHAKVSSSLHQTLASEAATEESKGVVVFAFLNQRDPDGSFPNLRVSLQKGLVAPTRTLEAGLRTGLVAAGATSVSVKALRYRYGNAVVGMYAQGNPNRSAPTIHGVQIYVAHESNLFVMTLASADQNLVDQAGTTVSSTLRFT